MGRPLGNDEFVRRRRMSPDIYSAWKGLDQSLARGAIQDGVPGTLGFVAEQCPRLVSGGNPRSFDFLRASGYDYRGKVLKINRLPTERHEGGPVHEIQMRRLLVSGLCGTKSQFTPGQDMAMAHRMVSGLEGLPKGVGRERRCQDIVMSGPGLRVPKSVISSQERASLA